MNILDNRDVTLATINRVMARRRRAWIISDAIDAYEAGDVKRAHELLAKAASIRLDGSN